jgi:hypothetical protein
VQLQPQRGARHAHGAPRELSERTR